MKKLLLIAALLSSTAQATETDCLAAIANAESRGESFEGLVAVMQAAITRAHRQETTICKERGVQRKAVKKPMDEYFKLVGEWLIKHPSISISKGADSWESTEPKGKGEITRKIDNHTFYILQPERTK